jgi:hypothetical protein
VSFDDFRRHVLATPALQAQLDGEHDARDFCALVVRLGAEHGYEFVEADVAAALAASRRTWMERWVV